MMPLLFDMASDMAEGEGTDADRPNGWTIMDSGRVIVVDMVGVGMAIGISTSGVVCRELFVAKYDGVDSGLLREDEVLADAGMMARGAEVFVTRRANERFEGGIFDGVSPFWAREVLCER
jgi:hypothetical protein